MNKHDSSGPPAYLSVFPVDSNELVTVTNLARLDVLAETLQRMSHFPLSIEYIVLMHGLLKEIKAKNLLAVHKPVDFTTGGIVSNSYLFECAYYTSRLGVGAYKSLLSHWKDENGAVRQGIVGAVSDVQKDMAYENCDIALRLLLQFTTVHGADWAKCYNAPVEKGADPKNAKEVADVKQATDGSGIQILLRALSALQQIVATTGLWDSFDSSSAKALERVGFVVEAARASKLALDTAKQCAPYLVGALQLVAVHAEIERLLMKAMAASFAIDGQPLVALWCKIEASTGKEKTALLAEHAKADTKLPLGISPPQIRTMRDRFSKAGSHEYPTMTRELIYGLSTTIWPIFKLSVRT